MKSLSYRSVLTNSTFILILTFFLLTLFSSCKKFVDVAPPKTQLVRGNVFTDDATATAAQVVIYSQMTASSYDLSNVVGRSSDEFINYNTFPGYIALFENSLTADDALNVTSPLWTTAYNYIYQANAVLEGLSNTEGTSAGVKKQLIGEALFTRAFWHLYLVNLYNDVPLVTTTDYRINAVAVRTPKTQIYQQIIADLNEAQNLLSSNYVGSDGISTTSERVRPTKWAAAALLARVYLYTENWIGAEELATVIINNTSLYNLSSSLNDIFLNNSQEAIWQITYSPTFNTVEGLLFILTSPPYDVALSDQLVNSFETGDQRKSDWIGSFDDGGTIYYFPYKYKIQYSTTATEYTMVLRLAEQYLIRVEARAQQNNITGAQADLNTIRNRAGLLNTTSNEKASLLLAIEHERQVELFTEWGHRWIDLKRTGRVDAVMTVVTPKKGGTWNTHQQSYPIPQTERDRNPNLSQNAGY